MTDISALLLLKTRRNIHDQLKCPAELGPAELQTFSAKVSSISHETSQCINEVTEYVLRIKDEIASLRIVLERFSVQLGIKIKDALDDGLTKGITTTNGPGLRYQLKEKDIDLKRAKHIAELQRSAKKQQDLVESINKMDGLIVKVEEEGVFSLDDIDHVSDSATRWKICIEKQQQVRLVEEEMKKKEDEVKIREEQERIRLKILEQKRAEEERKRQEKEENDRRMKREAEERRNIEEERRRRKEEKRRQEEERKRQEEEEKKIQREEEGRRRMEEERRQLEEQKRKLEEERKRLEEEENKRQEEEKRRNIEEERRRREEEELRRRLEEERRIQEEEERKRKEEEERKRQEEEERKRMEEERRRLEEERNKIEEERKRKEEEERMRPIIEARLREEAKRRRDPNNWPTYVYNRPKPHTSYHNGVCCAVSAIVGDRGLSRDDIECRFSDREDDLSLVLADKYEQAISSLVTIRSKQGNPIDLEMPMFLYIPHATAQGHSEVKLKISKNGGKWRMTTLIQGNPIKNESLRRMQYAGATVNNFKTIDIAVISKPKRQYEPIRDKNSKLLVPNTYMPESLNPPMRVVVNRMMFSSANQASKRRSHPVISSSK